MLKFEGGELRYVNRVAPNDEPTKPVTLLSVASSAAWTICQYTSGVKPACDFSSIQRERGLVSGSD